MSPVRSRLAMTLLEVLVALVLGGVLLLAVVNAVSAFGSHAAATRAASAGVAREAGARAAVGRLVMAMSASADSGDRFVGHANYASFTSMCPSGGGWLYRCRVELRVTPGRDGARAELRESSGGWRAFARGDASYSLCFLRVFDNAREWRADWGDSQEVPMAIAITVGRDTLVLGARHP